MERLGRGCQPVPSMQWNHRVHFLKVKSLIVALPQHPQSPSIILRPFGSCCYGDHKQNGMQINTSNNSRKGQGEAGVGRVGEGPGNASTCTPRGWRKKRLVEGLGKGQGGSSLDSSGRRTLRLQRCLAGGQLAGENATRDSFPPAQPQALTGQTEGEPALGEGARTRRGPPGRETPGLLPLWDEPGRSAL